MHRFGVIAVITLTLLCFQRNAAKADCGMHAFDTTLVPQLRAAEALSLTPPNVMRTSTDLDASAPPISEFDIPTLQTCSDDPALRNATANTLTRMWGYSIQARGLVAALSFVLSGQTNAPKACYAVERAETRYWLANRFAGSAPDMFSLNVMTPTGLVALRRAELVTALKRSKYYPRIVQLWSQAFRQVRMKYPGIERDLLGKWSTGYFNTSGAAKEHEPSGTTCEDQPDYYIYKP